VLALGSTHSGNAHPEDVAHSPGLRERMRSLPAAYGLARAVWRPVAMAREWAETRAWDPDLAVTEDAARPVVLVDGCVFAQPPGGVTRLWREVLTQWGRTPVAAHLVVLDRGRTTPRMPGIRYVDAPPLRVFDTRAQQAFLDRVCAACGADLFLSTWYTSPRHTPAALLVHDMTPENLGFDHMDRLWHDKHRAISHVTAFACISNATAEDLSRYAPRVRDARVAVVHPGVDPSFAPAPPEQIGAFRAAHGLPAEYYLFVGVRAGYKNARLLAEAWEHLPPAAQQRGILFAGGSRHLEPDLAGSLGRAHVVVATLSDEELRAAYSGATALVYPSRAEGFGLPVVEAMACGCPVIAGTAPALREAAGGGALHVDADDPAALAHAMERIADPAVRAPLVQRGLARAAELSWERTARLLGEFVLETAEETAQAASSGSTHSERFR